MEAVCVCVLTAPGRPNLRGVLCVARSRRQAQAAAAVKGCGQGDQQAHHAGIPAACHTCYKHSAEMAVVQDAAAAAARQCYTISNLQKGVYRKLLQHGTPKQRSRCSGPSCAPQVTHSFRCAGAHCLARPSAARRAMVASSRAFTWADASERAAACGASSEVGAAGARGGQQSGAAGQRGARPAQFKVVGTQRRRQAGGNLCTLPARAGNAAEGMWPRSFGSVSRRQQCPGGSQPTAALHQPGCNPQAAHHLVAPGCCSEGRRCRGWRAPPQTLPGPSWR